MNDTITITRYGHTATFSRRALLAASYHDELRIAIVESLAAQWGYRVVDGLSITEQLESIFEDIEAQLQV